MDAVKRHTRTGHRAIVESVAGEAASVREAAGSRGDILIVDDGPDNLRVLGELLRGEGYVARPYSDGAVALEAAAATPPDLILLDIMMPTMDGFEVCRRLKEDARLCDIPVIFLSA
ncbi:MAG TPA: response regulator, partial [Polyangia bacterium]